ncbi:MAG TPA: hypothetical protein VIY73_02715, partial [Polyangiaceae bacterium]
MKPSVLAARPALHRAAVLFFAAACTLCAACSLDFGRYESADASGPPSDASVEQTPRGDATSELPVGSDAASDAGSDAASDAGGDAGPPGPDCGGILQGCVDEAGACGATCGTT